jgi:hypothetical protein
MQEHDGAISNGAAFGSAHDNALVSLLCRHRSAPTILLKTRRWRSLISSQLGQVTVRSAAIQRLVAVTLSQLGQLLV